MDHHLHNHISNIFYIMHSGRLGEIAHKAS